ncbi:MAG: hypothetical protein M1831_004049 [Alyxoria varia]|nr:MAG: hypothetical protein M1831_004049 [Alyxoria varia]
MAREDIHTATTNRSIRTIKAELAFLADAALISPEQLQQILSQLPTETPMGAPIPLQTEPIPAAEMQNLSINNTGNRRSSYQNEKQSNIFDEKKQKLADSPAPVEQPPPAYPTAPAPPQSALTYVTALYAYTPTDAGDLALNPNDRIAVTEYMNAEWWKGKSESTGQEGIFPRSYVKVEEKLPPAQSPAPVMTPGTSVHGETSYGNAPLAVSQGNSGPSNPGPPGKFEQHGKKFGKKMGNATIFGAGATLGGKMVNSIF